MLRQKELCTSGVCGKITGKNHGGTAYADHYTAGHGCHHAAAGARLTAAVAECGGHSLLLDCGEGTQTAARRAGVNLMRADAICLTHYHGDHIFGLPGLLQTLGAQGRTRSLVLLGPEGLLEVWRAVYALTGPLPYAVKPLVCRAGQPVALDALSDGWPAGATLLPVATKHRVRSLGYRLDLPRAGRFDPEKARALGVPVTSGGFCSGDRLSRWQSVWCSPPRCWARPARGCGSSFRRQCACRRLEQAAQGQTCCSAMPPMPCRSSRSRPRSGGTAPLAKAQRWRQKPGQSGCGWCTIPHGHRPGGASCTGAKRLPGGRMRL